MADRGARTSLRHVVTVRQRGPSPMPPVATGTDAAAVLPHRQRLVRRRPAGAQGGAATGNLDLGRWRRIRREVPPSWRTPHPKPAVTPASNRVSPASWRGFLHVLGELNGPATRYRKRIATSRTSADGADLGTDRFGGNCGLQTVGASILPGEEGATRVAIALRNAMTNGGYSWNRWLGNPRRRHGFQRGASDAAPRSARSGCDARRAAMRARLVSVLVFMRPLFPCFRMANC